ncbi:MAG: ATP-binding protein [Clostridium sp.]
MIIKRIKIISFAGIKNKEIDFCNGINLVFGENEGGKSSIQEFIKVWLFGLGSGKKMRVKYLPLSGGIMEGELLVEQNEVCYLIKRKFGETKKGDSIEVLNFLTGEKLNLSKKEVGEVLLEVTEKTFSRTIFIGQQKIILEKEKKEDEIKERLKSTLSQNDDDVSIDRAIDKLREKRKEIQGLRGSGCLKDSNEILNNLNEELYKAERLKKEILEKEIELKEVKLKKKSIRESIENLEIYKKHLKRGNLKKEYEEIIKYFNKNEVNKKEKQDLYKELNKISKAELEILDKKFEEVNIIDLKVRENESNIEEFKSEKEKIKKENEKLDVFYSLGGNIKEKINNLMVETKLFKEKLESERKLKKLIEEEEKNIEEHKKRLNEKNLSIDDDINKMKELLESINNKFNIKRYIGVIMALISVAIIGFIIDKKILIIVSLFGIIGVLVSYFILNLENSMLKRYKFKNINELKEGIRELEEVKNMEEKANLKIEERLNRIEDLNIEKGYKKYTQSEEMLRSIRVMTESVDERELLLKVGIYESIKGRLDRIEEDIRSNKKRKEFLYEDKSKIEEEILLKVQKIDSNVTVEKCKDVIEEYKEKLKRENELKEDIERNNETYKALLKDRDIYEIRKEIEVSKDLVECSSYKKEEEIDEEVRNSSKELIFYEKRGKELEGEIKYILEKERDINIIEEDIFIEEERIKELRKKMKALDISIEKLESIDRKLKEKFTPKINEYVGEIFSKITNNRYKNVILKENYSLEIEGERWFSSEYLSKGTKDQLYLALRFAIIKILFERIDVPIILDEAFSQYDDRRREEALKYLYEREENQTIIFTCQGIEKKILEKLKISYNEIVI